jgi:hypothetical protein
MLAWLKTQAEDCLRLFRAIPSVTMTLFVLSVVLTNLMAAKFIVYTDCIQVTGGLLLSWLPFLCMDMTAKHFGAMAAVKLNLLGLAMYLACVGFFQLVVVLQYTPAAPWADYSAFREIYGAQWKVLVASSSAFVFSGVVNAAVHHGVGRLLPGRGETATAYFAQSWISTFVGQFADNFLFVGLLNVLLSGWGWPMLPVLGAALLGGLLELLTEMAFSAFGYRAILRWRAEGVGRDYLARRRAPSPAR